MLSRLERRASAENPTVSLDKPASWLTSLFGSSQVAGVTVNPETAIKASTVFACVRLISETLASLPLVMYRTDGKMKEKAIDHPLYWLLKIEPNRLQSSFQWLESEQASLLLNGNSYSEIEYNRAGQIIGIWPLKTANVLPFIENNEKKYRVSLKNGGTTVLTAEKILHIPAFGTNGITGLSPVDTGKGAIGLALAAEKFGEKLFANGIRTTGVLKHPGILGDTAYENLKTSFKDNYEGLNNSGKPMILEEGMSWESISMTPDDAQMLETRKFQVSEIARIFNVPPHMIGDLERSTNNNIEQQSLEFVQYSLRSWIARWESELNRRLLKPSERQTYYFKFLVDGLLRGDVKSRFEAYNLGRNMGIYSTNDILSKEDQNPVPWGDDDHLRPLNMELAKNPPTDKTTNPTGSSNGQTQ